MSSQERSPCGQLRVADVGQEVQVVGWVDALRDHGVVLFIHLRDRSGIVQVVFSPDEAPEVRKQAASLKEEFCVAVTGHVVGLGILGVLIAKLAWEQISGPLPGSAATAGVAVIVDAHLYGAAGGILALLPNGWLAKHQPRVAGGNKA